MISNLYVDLDESCVSTQAFYRNPPQKEFDFIFDLEEGERYGVKIREGAKDLIQYAQLVLGHGRVCFLTAATYDYAKAINSGAGFNIPENQIFAREHWAKNYADWTYWSPHNALIDNLPFYDNHGKIQFLGINKTYETQYLNVRDYYGAPQPDYDFFEVTKNFIDNLVNS